MQPTLLDYLLLWQVVLFFGVPLGLLVFVVTQDFLTHD
jgi:hypothetical protein